MLEMCNRRFPTTNTTSSVLANVSFWQFRFFFHLFFYFLVFATVFYFSVEMTICLSCLSISVLSSVAFHMLSKNITTISVFQRVLVNNIHLFCSTDYKYLTFSFPALSILFLTQTAHYFYN